MPHGRGTSTRSCSTRTATWALDGLLPTDRTHVVKLFGSYLFKTGTTVGVNFYGGSGTPVTETVQSVYRYPIMVEGRGSLGRTDALTQTDLLVSHDVKMGGSKRLRLEFNVLNLFDQQQVRHVFTDLNRIGANGACSRAPDWSWPTRIC
jgi:outer membrane receptor protein involved in Fe transport